MTTVRLATAEDLPALLALRHEVFVVEQRVPESLELDGLDDRCAQLVAFDGSELVGTARLRETPEGYAKAERVAVRASRRGQGAGVALMRALEAEAGRLGRDEVVLDAQVAVRGFYERLGYRAEGPEFDDAGIPHQRMRRRLS